VYLLHILVNLHPSLRFLRLPKDSNTSLLKASDTPRPPPPHNSQLLTSQERQFTPKTANTLPGHNKSIELQMTGMERDSSSDGPDVLTQEELMGDTNLKRREWRHIDPERWDDDVEAPDDNVDTTAATTYIARAIADYTDRPTADDELFGEFCQDFNG